jgi:D-amino-acid dehydrogenase
MKTIVMGGGVIGVATAWYLAEAGHEVTVIERRDGVGRETSFANAGLVTPGHALAWASPRAPMLLLKSLFQEDTALRFRLSADPRLWGWSLRFLANCTTARNRANSIVKVKLCSYSLDALIGLRGKTGITYDESTRGCLYLYRDREHYRGGLSNMAMLIDNGAVLEALDTEACLALEPTLAHLKDRIVGAIHAPQDESGDAFKFTERLAELCKSRGVNFALGTTIIGIATTGGRIEAVDTDRGRFTGDHYVLSLGSYSPLLVRRLGIKLPVYPIKGYSVTVPTDGFDGAPTIGGVDEGNLLAFCPLGDRLRLTATAEFAGYDTDYEARHFASMLRLARELFPRGGAYDKPSYWACLRPMTPDGPPVIGGTRYANLWLNTGHGHMGWTMACGSGRITADLIQGRKPEIDVTGFDPARY